MSNNDPHNLSNIFLFLILTMVILLLLVVILTGNPSDNTGRSLSVSPLPTGAHLVQNDDGLIMPTASDDPDLRPTIDIQTPDNPAGSSHAQYNRELHSSDSTLQNNTDNTTPSGSQHRSSTSSTSSSNNQFTVPGIKLSSILSSSFLLISSFKN